MCGRHCAVMRRKAPTTVVAAVVVVVVNRIHLVRRDVDGKP